MNNNYDNTIDVVQELQFNKGFSIYTLDDELSNDLDSKIKMYQELADLKDCMNTFSQIVLRDGETLNKIEDKVQKINDEIQTTVIELKNVEQNINSDFISKLKIIGGVAAGGLLFGGIGGIFGLVPALIGLGVGSGTGGLISYTV